MKTFLVLFTWLVLVANVSAQTTDKAMIYKKYAGRYGGSSGICLFEDGKFLMYGYATAVFGRYDFAQNRLLFYPDKLELFEVFAHNNKSIGDSTRINFKGFERHGKTFIQFGNNKAQRVFNDGANCFDEPFVYAMPGKSANFTLSVLSEESAFRRNKLANSWYYGNSKGYNDFIFIYQSPEREYEDFNGSISTVGNVKVLKLSNYGGEEGYRRHATIKEDDSQWAEVLAWKQEYDQSKDSNKDVVFANKHYNVFSEARASNHQYDEPSNQYINIANNDNDAYYMQNQYNDDRFLRKYAKLLPQRKQNIQQLNGGITAKSIFFTVCSDGSERSYKYNGFIQQIEPNTSPPIKMEPVKVDPGKKGNN